MALAMHRPAPIEIVERSTLKIDDLLDPVLDTMEVWRARTEIVLRPWSRAFSATDDGRLAIDGYPLHPHVEDRLMRMMLGISIYKQQFWMDNPDLVAQAMNRAPAFVEADLVQYRIIDNQIVYITNLQQEFGHHLDFFQPMARGLKEQLKNLRSPVSLAGYLVDPVWTHLRILFLPRNHTRNFEVGVSLDSNYTFSKYVRGRALVALFAYSTRWGSMLTFDEHWSIRTPRIQRNSSDRYLEYFENRIRLHLGEARPTASKLAASLSRIARRKAPRPWRHALVAEIRENYVSLERMRQVTLEMNRREIDNAVDFGFLLTSHMLEYDLRRAIVGEREVAERVRGIAER